MPYTVAFSTTCICVLYLTYTGCASLYRDTAVSDQDILVVTLDHARITDLCHNDGYSTYSDRSWHSLYQHGSAVLPVGMISTRDVTVPISVYGSVYIMQ